MSSRSLEQPNFLASPSPVGYGWKLEDNQLQIVWGTQEPAPESILECVHCKCQKDYKTRRCSCYKSDLKCTEFCQCNSCENSDILADELIELKAQFLENEFELEECDVDEWMMMTISRIRLIAFWGQLFTARLTLTLG